MSETIIDILRHGKPEGGRLYRGAAIDNPLSGQGWDQMWRAVGDKCHWNRIVSSPLQRCLAFAESLAEKHQLPLSVVNNFREVGFGSWEGRRPDQIQASEPDAYAAFYRDPVNCRPTGAEPLVQFGRRVADALEGLIKQHPGEHLLVVAHAGVIRAALGHVMQSPPAAWYRVKVDNAALTRFQKSGLGYQLIFHNRRRI